MDEIELKEKVKKILKDNFRGISSGINFNKTIEQIIELIKSERK